MRAGFVLEQTLGHVTHSVNLKRILGSDPRVTPTWLDVPFRPGAAPYKLPPVSLNWSLRGSLYARRQLEHHASGLDALFVHTMTVSLLGAAVYERVPTVISLDATPTNLDSVGLAYNHRRQPALVEAIKQRLTKRALSRAKAYVTWCEWAKTSLVDDYGVEPARVSVIAPGADLGLFDFGPRQPHDGPVRILFVGGDFQRKGGDLLIEALRTRLKGRAELHIVTGTDVPPEEDVFVYRGLTANSPALLDLFRKADIFALPTRADCLAMVLSEAMAASLPVITTPVGAHAEAVRHGETGYLVEEGESLKDALETLVSDEALRLRMGKAGREFAEDRFDAEKNARALLDVMEACR